MITRLGTAGNPYLGYDEAVFPDFHIMAEMDKIVYFSTPFDNGAVKSSIIDARTGPDFYVIADFDIANLGNARMTAFVCSKAKLTADNRMGTDDKTISELAVFVDDSTGINDGIVTDRDIIATKT